MSISDTYDWGVSRKAEDGCRDLVRGRYPVRGVPQGRCEDMLLAPGRLRTARPEESSSTRSWSDAAGIAPATSVCARFLQNRKNSEENSSV